jgi:hypothetical protein
MEIGSALQTRKGVPYNRRRRKMSEFIVDETYRLRYLKLLLAVGCIRIG